MEEKNCFSFRHSESQEKKRFRYNHDSPEYERVTEQQETQTVEA